MKITVTNNETGDVLYEGSDSELAQAAIEANGAHLPNLAVHAGADRNNCIGPDAAIDDEIDVRDCDVTELVWLAERKRAQMIDIFMNAARSEEKAS